MTRWYAFDRWRERQAWLPVWLDDTDPKTWAWHGFITAVAGFALSGSVWLLTWALPLVQSLLVHPRWGAGAASILYLIREVLNVLELRRKKLPLKPVDHVGDVVVPFAVALVFWL